MADFTGAHLLHLAAAGCMLDTPNRKAAGMDIARIGVRVSAAGGFNTDNRSSTGISYSVELGSAASPAALCRLLVVVDEVAEIPKAIPVGTRVSRSTTSAS
ncbi:hypothetical protein [Streptomyces sp. NBC_00989]|uniref:hypothetical protein n=1 Tax=Streptomyces sp. NBC_00989 TaxID=2903705 RepID=UPI00386982C0|nr:hypothetical protein OG714_51090 [Streptomyces sp. NBC_00989]